MQDIKKVGKCGSGEVCECANKKTIPPKAGWFSERIIINYLKVQNHICKYSHSIITHLHGFKGPS
jgi:hypothetical protein